MYSIIKPFKNGICLKYSDNEKVRKYRISPIQYSEVLKKYENSNNQIEITTLADIPSELVLVHQEVLQLLHKGPSLLHILI